MSATASNVLKERDRLQQQINALALKLEYQEGILELVQNDLEETRNEKEDAERKLKKLLEEENAAEAGIGDSERGGAHPGQEHDGGETCFEFEKRAVSELFTPHQEKKPQRNDSLPAMVGSEASAEPPEASAGATLFIKNASPKSSVGCHSPVGFQSPNASTGFQSPLLSINSENGSTQSEQEHGVSDDAGDNEEPKDAKDSEELEEGDDEPSNEEGDDELSDEEGGYGHAGSLRLLTALRNGEIDNLEKFRKFMTCNFPGLFGSSDLIFDAQNQHLSNVLTDLTDCKKQGVTFWKWKWVPEFFRDKGRKRVFHAKLSRDGKQQMFDLLLFGEPAELAKYAHLAQFLEENNIDYGKPKRLCGDEDSWEVFLEEHKGKFEKYCRDKLAFSNSCDIRDSGSNSVDG